MRTTEGRIPRATFALVAMAAAGSIAAPTAGAADQITPLVGRVLAAPQPVAADDGRRHLAYEIELVNHASSTVTLQRVEVVSAGRVIDTVQGDRLVRTMGGFGGAPAGATLAPGAGGLVLLDVAQSPRRPLPRRLTHRITIDIDPADAISATTYVTAPTRVVQRAAVVIAPPLRGPRWVIGSGCCDSLDTHRGAVLAANGGFDAPERFAIDFVQLDAQNRLFAGPASVLTNYPGFGAGVFSVSGGRVVGLVDGVAEGAPPDPPPGITAANAGGNYVVVDMGGDRYAFYAHLQPGSIAVKIGDRVRTGQKLGLLGNTGNSTGPHLHFHVMDSPSPLGSSGVPYRFTRFRVAGTIADPQPLFDGGAPTITPPPSGTRRNEMPLNFQVVDFEG
jgi:hypothetical protein